MQNFNKIIKSVKEFFARLWEHDWFQIVCYLSLVFALVAMVVLIAWRADEQCYSEATTQEQVLCQKDHSCSCVRKASYDLKFKELQR